MAASSGAGAGLPIDPTKPGKYPVVLSDALLGKASKDAYTGVRYNHRPELSDGAPATARIKQSSKDNNYNLGFEDNGNKYQYNGERTNNDGKYILVFDPARKVFVLHRIDSMFHMNVTRTPTNADPESLRKEFPHLTVSTFKKPPKPLPKKKNNPLASQPQPPKPSEPEKEEKHKPVSLSLPTVSKNPVEAPRAAAPEKTEKKPKRAKTPESDEDDDDDDGGLLFEYPGGNPASFRPPPPAFPTQMTRRFSEFVRDQDDDDNDLGPSANADVDAEFEEEDDDDNNFQQFKLPSPVNQRQGQPEQDLVDMDADGEADDFGDDLEAELERELLGKDNGMDVDDESDVSEED